MPYEVSGHQLARKVLLSGIHKARSASQPGNALMPACQSRRNAC